MKTTNRNSSLQYSDTYKNLKELVDSGFIREADKQRMENIVGGLGAPSKIKFLQKKLRAETNEVENKFQDAYFKAYQTASDNTKEAYQRVTDLKNNKINDSGDTEVASTSKNESFDTSDVVEVDAKNVEDFIAGLEKFRAKAYNDVDRLSIGYGTIASSKDEVITELEARKRLKADIKKAKSVVLKADKKHKYNFTSNQIDALTSFTYNAGQGNFSKLIDNGLRGIEEIADSIELYNKAGGKVLGGLVDRRKKEYALFTLGYK